MRQVSILDTPYEFIRCKWVGQRVFDVVGRPVNGATMLERIGMRKGNKSNLVT